MTCDPLVTTMEKGNVGVRKTKAERRGLTSSKAQSSDCEGTAHGVFSDQLKNTMKTVNGLPRNV